MGDDLRDLEDRIKAARVKDDDTPNEDMKNKVDGMRTGSEFLASVIGAAILGYIIDRFAGTVPWGLLGCMVLGFVSATIRAQKAMNK
ncbi:MAG: AtpZ/AtpI family protein [Pseudomonadota bacterium]